MSRSSEYEVVLEFWFGKLDEQGRAPEAKSRAWFEKNPAFDREIENRFGALHDAVAKGQHESWLSTSRGLLAYVLVLDQFSRNMFRNTPRAFAFDAQALAAARTGVARGADRELAFDERGFSYMPFMHSEDLEAQEECVRLFEAFAAEVEGELRERVKYGLRYAEQHRDMIRRFRRFPHRNAILGRESTAEELEFLKQPGSSF